jgi:hypothetical protein
LPFAFAFFELFFAAAMVFSLRARLVRVALTVTLAALRCQLSPAQLPDLPGREHLDDADPVPHRPYGLTTLRP